MNKNQDKKVQEKIEELKKEIENFEYVDMPFWGDDLRELQYLVYQVHTALDSSMNLLIARHFGRDILFGNVLKAAMFSLNVYETLDEVDFRRKVKLFQNYFSKTNKDPLVKKMLEVNDVRNYFAHPHTYKEKLRAYKRKDEYLTILNTLKEAKLLMEKEIEDRYPQEKKETK